MKSYDKEPLKKVARRLLKDDKEDFNASESSRQQYLDNPEYRRKVESYCLHDASLTRRIGEHLIAAVHTFLPTKNFTSRASIAEQYFLRNGYSLPQDMRYVFKPFLMTYWGGRFELTRRGFIPYTYTADIKSAYPAHMAELDILTTSMEVCQRKDGDYTSSALYGAYRIDLQVPRDQYLGPIPYIHKKGNSPIFYPTGNIADSWVDLDTLRYLSSRNYDFQIKEGVEIFDQNARKLLQKPILTLFSIKENKKNDEGVRNSAKIIMNSAYGKTIQLVDDAIGEIMALEEAQEKGYDIDAILPEGVFATKHTGIFKAGSMFCPPYGSRITSRTRIQILEAAEYTGFENVIAIQTDSLSTVEKCPPIVKGLGGWDFKGVRDMCSAKSGFYQYQDTGDVDMDPAWKIFNTPVETKARSYAHITDITQSEYIIRRRTSMKEAASRNDFTNQNVIALRTLANDINTDRKRKWDSPITPDDLRPWGRVVDSQPFHLA